MKAWMIYDKKTFSSIICAPRIFEICMSMRVTAAISRISIPKMVFILVKPYSLRKRITPIGRPAMPTSVSIIMLII